MLKTDRNAIVDVPRRDAMLKNIRVTPMVCGVYNPVLIHTASIREFLTPPSLFFNPRLKHTALASRPHRGVVDGLARTRSSDRLCR
jgi:hypothetical protein